MSMNLALFDLDNTLLNGDSDHGWGHYLAEIGVVDPDQQRKMQDEFYRQYVAGELDIIEFCRAQFKVLSEHPLDLLKQWRIDFMHQVIEPMIATGKADLIESHRQQGDHLVIITATNDFVTAPIAQRLNVPHLIATTAQFIDGRYTGEVEGTPCFQAGKVTRLKAWLKTHAFSFEHSTFYSDSFNDLPLLEWVDTPVAVTPDQRLREHAERLHWKVID